MPCDRKAKSWAHWSTASCTASCKEIQPYPIECSRPFIEVTPDYGIDRWARYKISHMRASITRFEQAMPRTANRGSFQPGISSNPGGRPKVLADVQAAAQEHSVDAIRTLASIMNNAKAPAAARIAAASALLDRGYGKPSQAINANTNVHYFVSDKPMSDEEWAEKHVTEH